MKLTENITLEDANFSEADGVRVIRNVTLLGPVSSHGYSYSETAMRRAVQDGLYDGVRCFLNHGQASSARSVMDLAGMVENARYQSDRIKGDIRLLPDQFGEKVWNIGKLMPRAAGFSHVADGDIVQRDGGRVVEKITKVFSVDCVTTPATTKGIFEGDDPASPPTIGDSSIPVPKAGEKKYEYIPRCLRAVKAANENLGDTEAGAMCFATWDTKFEAAGGVDEDSGWETMPEEPKPANTKVEISPAVREQLEKADRFLAEGWRSLGRDPKTGQPINSPERTQAMTLQGKMDERDRQFEQASRITDPRYEDLVREETQEQDHREYQEQQRQARENKRRAEEISREFDKLDDLTQPDRRFAETAAASRSQERQDRRRQEEPTHRRAAEIAEESVPATGGLIE